jgi:hypothetical protein
MATTRGTSELDPGVKLAGVVLWGAAVSVALGVYANDHSPTHETPYRLFFTSTINLKVWLATVVVALAGVQVLMGLRLYDRIHVPREAPPWLGDAHRLVGTVAFLISLPIAYQCLWALGFQSTNTRVLVHSIAGCFFYGIFVIKVLSVRIRGLPGWLIPIAGGLAFAALVTIFVTSSIWFFTSRPAGIPLF